MESRTFLPALRAGRNMIGYLILRVLLRTQPLPLARERSMKADAAA
jgi:hypothetical protein